ncbi:DNA polymerase III subunit alpha [bacterium]|nr:DNA polymerase III subunit alpha [bacterium]
MEAASAPVTSEFVHLHIHSEYSLLDGSIKVKKLVKELATRQAKAAALTDHDGLHGAVEFYLECQKEKINGIIGYEANVVPIISTESKQPFHLILLAENNQGYANIIKLCSLANTSGKNRLGPDSIAITREELANYSSGIICLTSCLKGELQHFLLAEENEKAEEFLDQLITIFGANNVFVELMDNNIAEQKHLIHLQVAIAKKKNLGIVATADVHYLKQTDRDTHLSLMAIKHKLQKTDVQGFDPALTFHLATAEEMISKFSAYPEAIANTAAIAARCKVSIDTKSIFMPDFRQRPDETADNCLARLSREMLEQRKPAVMKWMGNDFSEDVWQTYKERLEYELGVINKMKFAGYFLIVQDFINWAKERGIPVGPGRGSAAGSLVTYSLRITNIDPIRFNLLFERFLNPERISMPDIDTDFCMDRRSEVLEYVYKRYGARNVSQIVTFGRMMAKNALKNLARILGWSFNDSNEFAKLIPEQPGITLEQAYKEEERLRDRLENDERARILWNGALAIEGTLNSLGIHAAGVIISDRALDESCPQLESEGQMITQFEHKFAEKIGLIKFDFLGLKTLTVIEKSVTEIRNKHNPSFDIESIDLEDPKVYEMVSTAHLTGIFQLESSGMRKLISELKPTCFSDVVAVEALFRPGPLGSGMVADFVNRKHGKTAVEFPFPELEPILADTYGVIVYQEQVQKIAAVLANYSLGEADLLRRAMGKKDKAEMDRQKARFVEGAAKNGHNPQRVSEFFDLIAKFAEYGFNKSHSAAYAYVTFQTAFLKTYYPTEFMAAIMSCDLDNTDKIVSYVRDCKRMQITLLPPSVNSAEFEFTIPSPMTIQFGLGAIKGLGKGIIDLITAEREKNGTFETVPEFIARLDPRKINKKVLESLIKSGAFDEIATNRAELLANSDHWLRSISKESERQDSVGDGIFDLFSESGEPAPVKKASASENASPNSLNHRKSALHRAKKFDPLALPTRTLPEKNIVHNLLAGVQLKKAQPWSLLDQLNHEKSTLGFYMCGHPADLLSDDLSEIAQAPICDALMFLDPDEVPDHKRRILKIAGIITLALEKVTKEGKKFGVYRLEDGSGEIEFSVFASQYAALINKPKIGDASWVELKVRKGIEEGSVKGICQTLGFVSDKRAELAKQILLVAEESFINRSENIDELLSLVSNHRGRVPLALDVSWESEQARLHAKLSKYSVHPSDELIFSLENKWPGEIQVRRIYRAGAAAR